MKKITTLCFILFTSCMNSALAATHYQCREAIPTTGSYEAALVPGGALLQIISKSTHPKRVQMQLVDGKSTDDFKAKVILPTGNTQGYLGGFINVRKQFDLTFAVLPYYKEANTHQEFLGGFVTIGERELIMLCETELEDLFSE